MSAQISQCTLQFRQPCSRTTTHLHCPTTTRTEPWPSPGTSPPSLSPGFYFLAMYLFIGASFEFFSLGALLYAAFR